MEAIEGMVYLTLAMWMFFSARQRSLFLRRLMEAKQNTANKKQENLGTPTTKPRRNHLICSMAYEGKLILHLAMSCTIVLWKLATGSEYRSVGHNNCVLVCSGVLCCSRCLVGIRTSLFFQIRSFKKWL